MICYPCLKQKNGRIITFGGVKMRRMTCPLCEQETYCIFERDYTLEKQKMEGK